MYDQTPDHQITNGIMEKFADPTSPPIIPPSVKIKAWACGQWWDCYWKGHTLCCGAGVVFQTDTIWVVGETLEADKLANRLRREPWGYKKVGLGVPEEEPKRLD